MAEWSKAHDWKSCVPPKGTEGSNPSLSAINIKDALWGRFFVNYLRIRDLNPRKRGFDYKRKAGGSAPVSVSE